MAAYYNHSDCVKVLLEDYDASINATNKYGQTALHHAAGKGHVDVVRTLVSSKQCDVRAQDKDNNIYGASINAANKRGDTPLHLAAAAGYTDMVELLTSYRQCDFDKTNKSISTPAEVAEDAGHTAITEYLNSLHASISKWTLFVVYTV